MTEVPAVDEAERIAGIAKRIQAIEDQLFARSNYVNSSILSRPIPKQQLEHERQFDALRREREGLLAQLPVTGERAGHLVLAGHFLRGTTIVRESVEEYRPAPGDEYGGDPLWRYAREQGWDPLD